MSELDSFRQNQSMAQQISNLEKYKELVQYIGEESNSKKIATLNALIKCGMVRKTPIVELALAKWIEDGKAYAVANRFTEITLLGLILGDTRKKISGTKNPQ